MPFCAYKNCVNYWGHMNKTHGIIFHKFPINESCLQKWIEIFRRQRGEPDWTPSKYCRVCSLHFHPDHIFKTNKGSKRIIRGAIPYIGDPDNFEEQGRWNKNQSLVLSIQDSNEPNLKDVVNPADNSQSVTQDEIVVQSEMEVGQEIVVSEQGTEINSVGDENKTTSQPKNKQRNSMEGNSLPLDKFKRRLVRGVARLIKEKKPEAEMWQELKKEIGCDCYMLWQHMRALTLKKLRRLLPANDLLANLKKIARFTATDWLLFDLILVHEKINVISVNDVVSVEDQNKDEPQCLHDLFELVKEHNVEFLTGDDLIEAWIRVTLQYNRRGRQCSPMLLQLRWYQLKELARARFYNFWCEYRGNQKMLDRAMKIKPTELQTAIAKEFKPIITQIYPEWEKLIEERRVILSEEFTLNRESKRKAKKAREDNDIELELIEPRVETIELEVDSDEEHDRNGEKACNTDSSIVKNNNEEAVLAPDENIHLKNTFNNVSTLKSDSDDDVLELDGLSDVESMHIPLEEPEEPYEEGSNTDITRSNVNELLPKITNVIGNIVESFKLEDEDEMDPIIQKKVTKEKNTEDAEVNPCIETEDSPNTETEDNPYIENEVKLYTETANNSYTEAEDNPYTDTKDNLCAETEDDLYTETEDDPYTETEGNQYTKTDGNPYTETEDRNNQCISDDDVDEIIREKAISHMNINIIRIKSEGDLELPQEETKTTNDTFCSSNKSVKSDSDDEIDKLLQEKANNMSFEIPQRKADLELPQEETKTTNDTFCSSNKSVKSDSDDEIDKLLQEKANNMSFEIPQRTAELSVKVLHENQNIMENITGNDDSHKILNKNDINEEDQIAVKEETLKKENYDDGFDEVEIDNDQIEFVDDGIEFVEEISEDKKKTIELKTEPSSESEDESKKEIDDYPKIDLKLLMNPTVYTQKLDLMEVFKCTDYKFVNDKRIIERAINESKPVDKVSLKDEDIDKFREQALCGYETDGTQSDNYIVQTPMKDENYKVKCTSWLLQKPKKRSYNPIQLCKNPDFNTRLKRLTAGFLSSTRNRVLLKECKPLTIDLHKSFEKKLVNGTIYLKSSDFKSANTSTVAEHVNNETASVLPSLSPGMIPPLTSISTMISNKSDNHEGNVSLLSIAEKCVPSERRKIINLPDIEQVRRVNQSLLTAEVTPIRIDGSIVNTNSCKEPPKASTVEPAFVQPITLAPIVQVKSEPFESDLDDKNNLKKEFNQTPYETSSAKDLMAHKINNQIIDLSNQISEVDNNELLSIDVEKTMQKLPLIKNKVGRKPKNNVEKPKSSQNVNLTFTPMCRDKLTWTPKYRRNYVADSLLTTDTLSKILSLLNGNENVTNKSSKEKKKKNDVHTTHCMQMTKSTNRQKIHQLPRTVFKSEILSNPPRGRPKKVINRAQIPQAKKLYTGVYCCWAREKILSLIKKQDLNASSHGCLEFQCQCCCRHELVTMTIGKQTRCYLPAPKKSKMALSAIVLSDDEDITTIGTQKNKEIDIIAHAEGVAGVGSDTIANDPSMSNEVTMNLDKVAFEIVIQSTSNIDDTFSTSANIAVVKNICVQSEENTQKSLSESHSFLSSEENEQILKKKSCKTIVRAADGHVYNKRTRSDSSIVEEQNSSNIKLAKSVRVKDPSSKKIERTLYLNSSQILNKPNKAPIYLGKNKILLCSVKNPSVPQMPVTPVLPVLPYGVHFIMLPTGELTLSIDNGIQLDSEQLSALPALMYTVQQQFLKSNISNNIPINIAIPPDYDMNNVKAMEEINVTKHIATDSLENANTAKEIEDTSAARVNLDGNGKEVKSDGKNGETEVSSKNFKDIDGNESLNLIKENETIIEKTNKQETVNKEAELVTTGGDTEIEIEKENTKPQIVENQKNNYQTTECLSSVDPCPIDQDGSDISESKNTYQRKTILSDLMEMSGISAEDTSVVTDITSSCTSITPLPPTIIPVTRTSRSGIDVLSFPTNSIAPETISTLGQYSNLLSFEPTTPTNRLLNCIAQMRPELNAVTSFAELRYVYNNGGHFYKLDVKSGVITEIKVFIKKNPKSKSSTEPKVFIDLTDDLDDDENEVTCAEFQDIPQDEQQSVEVKPIKLFKAVHPGILKRSGRSILKYNDIVYPKKAIRINKHRRKQLLKVGNRYVLVGAEDKNEFHTSEVPRLSHDSSYDSSDEEPLAKKSKRNKPTEKNIEETPLFVDPPQSHISDAENVGGVPQIPDISGDMSDLETNSMDIEGVNPELHPVAFEEGSESDEDMCILGV